MRRRRERLGWIAGAALFVSAVLGGKFMGAPGAGRAEADEVPPAGVPAPSESAPRGPAAPAPPNPAAPPAPPVVRLTLDKARSKGALSVAGERPSSYAQVDLVLTNRTDEPLLLDLSGHHLRPTTSGCQRLGLSHPVTPRDPAPAGSPGTAPLDLAPRETKRVRMNTCCMDAGRSCPSDGDRFELAAGPTPPNVEVALRWWVDHPTAPQGFVNQAIWTNDPKLLARPFDRETPSGPREPIGPKGRRIRSYGGTLYTLEDGVLMSVDPEGVRRFHGTQIYDVHPRAEALYGIGQGIGGNDLWRFAATGEPPWGKVFPVGPAEELLDLLPVAGGAFLARVKGGLLEWRAGKDAPPSSFLGSEKATRFSLGPVDAAKGRYVAVIHQPGTPKAGSEAVGPGALSAVSSKFAVMDVDGRTGDVTVRKLYWNVRDMAAGPGGVFALSPVGTPERLDGERLRRIPCADKFDAIVLVGKAYLVLKSKGTRLHGFEVATGRISQMPAETDGMGGDALSIDPVTDDVVWVGEQGYRRFRFGATAVETIP